MSASATAVPAAAIPATASAAVVEAADQRAKAESEDEPIDDDGRLIDRRRDRIDRRRIGRRSARIALSVGGVPRARAMTLGKKMVLIGWAPATRKAN
jgi:hypothetical protein